MVAKGRVGAPGEAIPGPGTGRRGLRQSGSRPQNGPLMPGARGVGPCSQAEGGALAPALRPGPSRRLVLLERLAGPQRPPSDRWWHRGVDEPVGEQGVVGLLGGLVAIMGLLIRALSGVVAILDAGMLGIPHAMLLVKLGLTGGGLLLTALLAL